MSAPQHSTVLEVAHNLAPNYSLKEYQCYWYALIVFLIAKQRGTRAMNVLRVRASCDG